LSPTLEPLIGSWRTEGEVLGDDGVSVVATVEGTDAYEWLGPFVVHRIDVVIGGRPTRALEIVEPYDEERAVFPTRAYDDQGAVEVSTAAADGPGRYVFRAGAARAVVEVAGDGGTMRAQWTVPGDDGEPRPWMRLRFTRRA
jgi:hypothetical protein